jgi:hypothetical protein
VPEPTAPPKGKSGKLPTWAYIAAAGIGLLLAFFLLRRQSSDGQTAPAQATDQQPVASDQLGTLQSILDQIIAGAHGSGDNVPGGGTGSGCVAFLMPCTPGGPSAQSNCCTGNCSMNEKRCNCGSNDWACKALHPEHYAERPGKPHSRFAAVGA